VVRLAGGLYVTGTPLWVWGALSDPQSGLPHGASVQSTPALRGSLLTTAVILTGVLMNVELGGAASKAMETVVEGVGAG
jgi:hypothetical protein